METDLRNNIILVEKKLVYLKAPPPPSGQDYHSIAKEVDVFNVGGEQLLAEKRDIVYDESASSPNSNTSPMITDD